VATGITIVIVVPVILVIILALTVVPPSPIIMPPLHGRFLVYH
jgi:hypothetical protein